MPFRGIKSRVFLQFWLLFFIVLLLNELLIFFIFLEISISRTIEQKRQQLNHICLLKRWDHRNDAFENHDAQEYLDRYCFSFPTRLDGEKHTAAGISTELTRAVKRTLADGRPYTLRTGKTFGLLFPQAENLVLTIAVRNNENIVGACGIETSLAPIYQDFRRFQKITLVFITICSIFFALIGHRQLARTYFKPLKRLAKKAESYQDEQSLIFSVRKEDDEFSILSSSLNKMLNRIAENKAALKATIASLQTANEELQKAQRDIIRAEKMATVGRLTSGLAHEIGNPIGIVLGYIDLLKQEDLSTEERNDFLCRSEAEITRINHIIRQLLDMSRSSQEEVKAISIHLLLQELVDVFSYQPLAADIRFETVFIANHDCIHADPDQIRQVFLNIILNAIDAVNMRPDDQGRILLHTENLLEPAAQGKNGGHDFLSVTVKDNGPGIPPSILPRLFDPFFTTKSAGKGTGLGLSVSFMIVEQLGGEITAASNDTTEGGGLFNIKLPLSPADHTL